MNRRRRSWTLGSAIRHHLAALVLVVAVALLGAGSAVIARPPTYQATTLLFLDTRSTTSQGFDVALQTSQALSSHYIQIATTEPVLSRACSAYKSAGYTCTPDSLSGRVSANTVRGTSIIAVNAQARDPQSAAVLANSVADAVVKENQNEVDALVKSTGDYLDSELKQLTDQIAGRQAVIAQYINDQSPNGRAQSAQAESQLTLLQGQYSSAYQKKQDLTLSQNQLKGTLSVFQRAVPPVRPADPDPLLYLSAGLVGGILLGLLLVVLLERFDDRLLSVDDLVDATGSPVGLSVPTKALAADPGQQVRHYALARAYLQARRPDLRSLVVAAASVRDRAYPVAMGIGTVAARAGQRVLVVTAEESGFLSPLESNGDERLGLRALRTVRGRTRPRVPQSSANLVTVTADRATDELLAAGTDGHDLVIVAAAAPYADATGIYIARDAEFAVLVATARSTTFREAQRSAEALRRAGIDVVASVLIGGPPGSTTRVAFDDQLAIRDPHYPRPVRQSSAGPTVS